jgi:hypothetical protein
MHVDRAGKGMIEIFFNRPVFKAYVQTKKTLSAAFKQIKGDQESAAVEQKQQDGGNIGFFADATKKHHGNKKHRQLPFDHLPALSSIL